MKRRVFITGMAGILAASQAPAIVSSVMPIYVPKPTWIGFDPGKEYTELIQFTGHDDYPDILVSESEANMKKTVPPEYRQRVRMIRVPYDRLDGIDPLGQIGSIGWKYNPN